MQQWLPSVTSDAIIIATALHRSCHASTITIYLDPFQTYNKLLDTNSMTT